MRITVEDYKKIYKLLEPGPIPGNCGTLCKETCCQPHHDDMGIYLLPGEELIFEEADKDWLIWELHNPKNYDFPPSWKQPVY
ncbi:MAG: hypothetical protein AB1420_05360 [Bacillota bacterium]